MRTLVRRSGGTVGVWLAVIGLLAVVASLPGGPCVRADEGDAQPAWVSHATGLEVRGVTSLRIHPKAPTLMWAHVHGLGIARSEEGGRHWEVKQEGIDARHLPGPRDIVEISLDPRDEKILWVVTKGQIYKSEDQGESWQNMSTGALASWSWDKSRSTMAIRGVVVDPKKSLRILAGTRTEGAYRGGLYESNDGGKTWEQIAGDDVDKSELGHDAWPIVLDPRTDKNVAVGGSNGFWYSDDRGRKFRRADPGEIGFHDIRALTPISGRSRDMQLCDGRGLWSSRDGGKRWDRTPHLEGDCVTVAGDPINRRRLYAVLRDLGLFVSEDARHMKWEPLGHVALDIHEILRHPRDKTRLFFASPTTGLHVSKDGGVTIEPVKSNLGSFVPTIAAVAIHPVERDRALALGDHGSVFVSGDRGETWLAGGRMGMTPRFLVGDPDVGSMWWAAGRELQRSPDNGANWETVYEPEDPEDRILDVRRLGGTLWLLLERAQVIASSKDSGKTWEITKPPRRSPGAWASAFDIDPSNPKHLLMATRSLDRQWTPKDDEGGPWESWDGGETWKPLHEGLFDDGKPRRNWNRGRVAAIDPSTGVLFYAADGLGLFARLARDPADKKPDEEPGWVDISPPIPSLRVNAFLLRILPDDGGTELVVQAEGENDTRTLVKTLTSKVLEKVAAPAGAGPPAGNDASLWTDVPDAPARLGWLVADSHVAGRLLGSDRDGPAGVLVYGLPGAKPEAPVREGPAPAGPTAGAPPPDGLLAFSAGGDGQVRVWSLAEGKVLSGLAGSTQEVLALALAPDESILAVGGADKGILLYSGADGTKLPGGLAPDRYNSMVNGLAFGPDSKLLYAALQETWSVVELNVETGASRAFEAHTAGVTCVLVLPGGKQMVSGSRDHSIRVWDVETASVLRKMDTGGEVLCLTASADGRKVYVGGRGAAVKVYDLEKGTELGRIDVHRAYVSALAQSPDGTRLYAAGDRGIVAFHDAPLTVIGAPFDGPTKAVFCVAVSADGEWILGGDADNGLWMWRAGVTKPWWFSTTAHAGPVHAVVLTPDVAEKKPQDGGG